MRYRARASVNYCPRYTCVRYNYFVTVIVLVVSVIFTTQKGTESQAEKSSRLQAVGIPVRPEVIFIVLVLSASSFFVFFFSFALHLYVLFSLIVEFF